ncbi:MAG: hypothetical protein DMG98_18075 [Acidobacteria bacterium]|nr:MAG: hypothetical protein DMG98_18075 [Acidobacteriota bacterium]
MNPEAAKWQLYELEERQEEIVAIEVFDRGNVSTRLVRCVDETEVERRFASPIALVHTLMPEAEVARLSSAEVAFRCHGLEFARSRLTAQPGNFRSEPEIVFGLAAEERVLDGSNFAHFERLIRSIGEARHPDDPRTIVAGGWIRSVGGSRWWSRTFVRSMTASTRDGAIRKCRRSPPPIAP